MHSVQSAPSYWMVHSARPLILNKALWIPLLFTGISSCLCNAADIQQCIVMPGCPSALIPFKANPTGWHQGVGCCSNVWHLFKQLDKLASLPKTHPYWFLPVQNPDSFVSLVVSLCLVSYLCSAFIWRIFFSNLPTPFPPFHLRNTAAAWFWYTNIST